MHTSCLLLLENHCAEEHPCFIPILLSLYYIHIHDNGVNIEVHLHLSLEWIQSTLYLQIETVRNSNDCLIQKAVVLVVFIDNASAVCCCV